MYDGHICEHGHELPRAEDLPDIGTLLERQIRKVYEEKLLAGDIDADTWRHNTTQLWKGIQEGWKKAPLFASKAQLSLLELRRNVNVYAAFKNHSNVIELTQLLTGPGGEKLTFGQFKKLAKPLTEKYNQTWLRTEYDYATKSARAAAQWDTFKERGGKLQYMTIGDGRVREAHVALEGTILPVDAPFWKMYYPPNGWNCRCFVRWRPDDTETIAPQSVPDVNGMFLNNVGETSQIFTDDHPFIRQISEAQADLIRQIAQQETLRWERTYLRPLLKEGLVGKSTQVQIGEITASVRYSSRRLKEALNQPHIQQFEKNRAMLGIDTLLKGATYVQTVPNIKQIKNNVKQYHYLLTEIAGQPSYIVLEEMVDGKIFFHTIVDALKE